MYGYIRGEVVFIDSNYIIVDNNGIGYNIFVPNPYSYKVGLEYTVYTYTCIREDEHSLYGFTSMEDKDLFLKLINVKGLGPKMAIPIIATGSLDLISDAVENENVNYLKKFPKIGDKVARQIILDLKGKLGVVNVKNTNKNDLSNELKEVLVGLGYKINDINKIIDKVDGSLSLESQIKEALKLMLK